MVSESMLVFWAGDPLRGVVVLGSAGVVMWSLVAALVGSALGMLRELESTPRRAPVARRPRPGTRLGPIPPRTAAAVS